MISNPGMLRNSIATLALMAALVLSACTETAETAASTDPNPAEPAEVAAAVPQIAVLSSKEVRARLDAAKGTIAVVNFWATWCPPCVKETPELIAFYNEHHGKGVTFISLSVDHPSTVEKAVVPFVKDKAIPFPVYVVNEPNPDAISGAVGLEVIGGAVPVTWVVNAAGTPVKSFIGEVTAQSLEAAVAAAKSGDAISK